MNALAHLRRLLERADDNLADVTPLVLIPRQERRSISPDPMRCCNGVGWHKDGCGLLDQLDAGERRR